MLIQTNTISSENKNKLAFIKSLNVQVYPCGRRRSTLIGEEAADNSYFIPFDPEARLNTEANNRKYSALNGFTSTYINSIIIDNSENIKQASLSLAIHGYLFNIKLSKENNDPYENIINFANDIYRATDDVIVDSTTETKEPAKAIYANIRLEETKLFSGFEDYYTSILRNQSSTQTPSTSLDLLKDNPSDDLSDKNNYYFSGLSFSVEPLTNDESFANSIKQEENTAEYSNKTVITTDAYKVVEVYNNDTGKLHQTVISLCLFKRENGTWVINESARLPKVVHGDTENSIKVGNIFADSLRQGEDRISTPGLNLVEIEKDKYQLQFSFVDELPKDAE